MSNKSYEQYCSIAHALDLVGERWTLLIVRNLLMGSKRYGELVKGLPGISTNILAERLKMLEEKGIITTHTPPSQAASGLYQLTKMGYDLADTLTALARWGGKTLGKPVIGQYIVPEAVEFMVQGLFYDAALREIELICNVDVHEGSYEHTFGVQVSHSGVKLTADASSPEMTDVVISLSLEMLSTLSSKRAKLRDLVEQHAVTVSGEPATVKTFVHLVDSR